MAGWAGIQESDIVFERIVFGLAGCMVWSNGTGCRAVRFETNLQIRGRFDHKSGCKSAQNDVMTLLTIADSCHSKVLRVGRCQWWNGLPIFFAHKKGASVALLCARLPAFFCLGTCTFCSSRAQHT